MLARLGVMAVMSNTPGADVFLDAAELGGSTGAMACVLKKTAEDDGDYLWKKMTKGRCTSLRKMLYLEC